MKDELALDWPGDDILGDPKRIFNADESGFPISPTSKRVLAEKGQKQIYQQRSGKKEQLIVMVCANANGDFVPPSILYPGKRLNDIGMRLNSKRLNIAQQTMVGWTSFDAFMSEKAIQRSMY